MSQPVDKHAKTDNHETALSGFGFELPVMVKHIWYYGIMNWYIYHFIIMG